MKRVKRNYFILGVLTLLFTMPSVVAYFYFKHPEWLSPVTTNKGTLLNPPVFFTKRDANAKWRLLFWNPTACHASCLKQLDKLARIRLALGRRLYSVEQWLILQNEAQQLSTASLNSLREQDIHVLRLSTRERSHFPLLKNQAQIFIESPKGFLILAYEATANPDDIFHDIKQLVTITEKE